MLPSRLAVSAGLVAFNIQKFASRMSIAALKNALMALNFAIPAYDKMTYDSFVKYGQWTGKQYAYWLARRIGCLCVSQLSLVDALSRINNENM